ncbi:MAG TPA: PRC-barrel domain-containing protein [Trebonia sp.]|nr:PRC-barrel domain-containing protein [Trebonia sp.]
MSAEFTMGARVSCTDGFCGVVTRAILDPAAETVTHLVIQPKHRADEGRLVPVALVDGEAGEIRLRCTLAEFGVLEPAEEVELAGDVGDGGAAQEATILPYSNVGGFGAAGPAAGVGLEANRSILATHVIPQGETEVRRHESVHAVDGEIGRVEGFIVNPADHAVTHVLLQEGHLWGRKEVAIPVSAIASADDGIRLTITKKQVEDLPPVSPDGR